MSERRPDREWWSAAEIADARLVDMPDTRQGVEKMIKRLCWRECSHARKRDGRGGGWEYHWSLFPVRARRSLLPPMQADGKGAGRLGRDEAWSWFESLPAPVQDKARMRLDAIQRVEALVAHGDSKQRIVHLVGNSLGIPARTIWGWFALIDGVRPDDRLPYLAPRHRAAPARAAQVHCDPDWWDTLKSDYLRPAKRSFAVCYRAACKLAEAKGWVTLPERTARRRFEDEVSRFTITLCRDGLDALKRLYPPQVRDKSALRPLEVVNADFHKFDVFVEWPRERGQTEDPYIGRPQMVAFQDVYSGRILSWRIDQTPNALAVQLAAGDMIEAWGIPEHVLLDNGREFAAKSLTGGAPTRFRFKVREDDVPGLFVSLGCDIHWATPYAGQSKPIERAFRDMCDAIAKDPRFDGAYTGNSPMAKPEDYGSRAVPLEQFLAVLADGIEEHNTRANRRSEVAMGRSFAEVFDEAYATAPIRKATEAQRRLWLLGAEKLRADARTGVVRFMGNEYWDGWMGEIAGQPLIARFDPADLWSGLHLYTAENVYLGHAPAKAKVGFLDMEEARAHAKARRDWMNAEKAAAKAHRRFTASQIGTDLDSLPPAAPGAAPEAKVVRAVFGAAPDRRAVPVAPPTPDQAQAHAAVVADLSARRPVQVPEEGARDRYRRALELERAEARGEAMTNDQRRWLGAYQNTPEYRSEQALHADFGDAIFG